MLRRLIASFFGSLSRPPPEEVLLDFGSDCLTTREVTGGGSVLTLASVGRGKTSGPQSALEAALLDCGHDPGFLWLAVKADEPERAVRQVSRCRRRKRVHVFSPTSGDTLDVAAKVMQFSGNSVATLTEFLRILGQLQTRAGGKSEDPQWELQASRMRQMAIALLVAAGQPASLRHILDICQSAATSPEAMRDARWQDSNCAAAITLAKMRRDGHELNDDEAAGLEEALVYFESYLVSLGPKFAGSVLGTACAPLFALLAPPFGRIFGGGVASSLPIEQLNDGLVLIVAFPLLKYFESGLLATKAVEMVVDLMVLNRGFGHRPVVKVRDELPQFFVADWDAKTILVGRQSGLICLDVAQDLRSLVKAAGDGVIAEHAVKSFAAQHSQFFVAGCADADFTGKFFQDMLGEKVQYLPNIQPIHHGHHQHDENWADHALGVGAPHVSLNAQRWHIFEQAKANDPSLRNGGPAADWQIDCHLIVPGKVFRETGESYRRVTFQQTL